MPEQNLKQKVVKGAIWTLMEKFSYQIVQFAVSMVLVRLIMLSSFVDGAR